jgi:hypothetical protein
MLKASRPNELIVLMIGSNLLDAATLQAEKAAVLAEVGEVAARLSEYTSTVLASIILACSSIEASANELIFGCGEGSDTRPLSDQQRASCKKIVALAEVDRFEKLDPLGKFSFAAIAAGKKPLPKGKRPYQDADALMKFRNALVHFKPEWRISSKANKLESLLKTRFEELPNTAAWGLPSFPGRCLTHSAAAWACRSAFNYIEAAYENTDCGLKPLGFAKPFA